VLAVSMGETGLSMLARQVALVSYEEEWRGGGGGKRFQVSE